MTEVDIKDFLTRIELAPTVEPSYSEEYEIPLGEIEYKYFVRGTWNVTKGGRGLIRRFLLGPEQEPHPGAGLSGSNYDRLTLIVGTSVAPRGDAWVYHKFRGIYRRIYTITASVFTPVKTNFINRNITRIHLPRIELPEIPRIPIYCYGCLNNDCRYGWFSFSVQNRCPKCGSTNIRLYTEEDRFERVMRHRAEWSWRKRLGNWWILNPARDAVADTLVWLTYDVFGLDAGFMPVNLITAYVDRIWNELNEFRDNLQSEIDRTINRQIGVVENRVNEVLRDLYRMWGLVNGYVPTPAVLKDITNEGFKWYSHAKNMSIAFFGLGAK